MLHPNRRKASVAPSRTFRIAPTRRDLLRGGVALVALIGFGVSATPAPAHPRSATVRRPDIVLRWGDPLLAMGEAGAVAHNDFVALLPTPFFGEVSPFRGWV